MCFQVLRGLNLDESAAGRGARAKAKKSPDGGKKIATSKQKEKAASATPLSSKGSEDSQRKVASKSRATDGLDGKQKEGSATAKVDKSEIGKAAKGSVDPISKKALHKDQTKAAAGKNYPLKIREGCTVHN